MITNKKLQQLRREYIFKGIDEDVMDHDPLIEFTLWFNEYLELGVEEPNAFALATVDKNSNPSLRFVLLKELDQKGFIFFTNYNSKKAIDIESNPNVAATFFWQQVERQIRVEGKAEKVDPKISDDYFMTRPKQSQIGAITSKQSKKLTSRKKLVDLYKFNTEKFINSKINRPVDWGGYRIIPNRIEFWQGREHRLHDRVVYKKAANNSWKKKRLFP
ncbi:MAG TPA: pyridoxamine 5'-phosphate oxidase [Candidatus Dojkabacteria bacterium]|jgi:pyridoxamine 5'-phosphate oxidase